MPVGEVEWSRRAIINVVQVLGAHRSSLTLIGGHGVDVRTESLGIDVSPTSDGNLAITPGMVADHPSIEQIMLKAGYVHRTDARPGLWGRETYLDRQGVQQFHEKIDLSTGRALSGTTNPKKRSVPALSAMHGNLSVNNASGLELSAFDHSVETVRDIAEPGLTGEVNVAGTTALLIAKAYKVTDRLHDTRSGPVRDKDFADIWRLTAAGDLSQSASVLREYKYDQAIGASVREGVLRLQQILTGPAFAARAAEAFDGLVDGQRIQADYRRWASMLDDFTPADRTADP